MNSTLTSTSLYAKSSSCLQTWIYWKGALTREIGKNSITVNSRYLEVVGTIFYKFKLPEVQINLHFMFGLVKKSPTPNYGWKKQSKCVIDSDWRFEFHIIRDIRVRIARVDCTFFSSIQAGTCRIFNKQSNLDISNSDISNSSKLEASIWIKNTFWSLSPTIFWLGRLFFQVQISRSAN